MSKLDKQGREVSSKALVLKYKWGTIVVSFFCFKLPLKTQIVIYIQLKILNHILKLCIAQNCKFI